MLCVVSSTWNLCVDPIEMCDEVAFTRFSWRTHFQHFFVGGGDNENAELETFCRYSLSSPQAAKHESISDQGGPAAPSHWHHYDITATSPLFSRSRLEQETAALFQHLDANSDGNIDLAEFTRFCLEVLLSRGARLRSDAHIHGGYKVIQ